MPSVTKNRSAASGVKSKVAKLKKVVKAVILKNGHKNGQKNGQKIGIKVSAKNHPSCAA